MKTVVLVVFIISVLAVVLRVARLCICDYPIYITRHRYEEIADLLICIAWSILAASLLWK